jgi:hypothetical protein
MLRQVKKQGDEIDEAGAYAPASSTSYHKNGLRKRSLKAGSLWGLPWSNKVLGIQGRAYNKKYVTQEYSPHKVG